MNIFETVLRFLDSKMERPEPYGWFHLIFLALSFIAAGVLCYLWKRGVIKNVRAVVLSTAIIVIVCEVYKLTVFSFTYTDGVRFQPQWYAFPWQFCSTPMFIGLLTGLTKGKINKNLAAYLATYALFAGTAVMLYPSTVFIDTIGINIQTMICHGSMITIAIFLYYTHYVESDIKTVLYAMPVFAANMGVAITLNELAHIVGITEEHTFNMFYISPYFDSEIPVYNLIHDSLRGSILGWLFSILLYFLGFSLCAFIVSLIPYGIKKFMETDFEALYAEQNARLEERRTRRREELALLDERIDADEEAKRAKRLAQKEERERKRAERKARKAKRRAEKEAKRLARLEEEKRERELEKKRKKAKKKKEAEKKKQKKKEEKRRKRKEKKLKKKEKKEKAKLKKKEKKEKARLKREEKKEKLRLKLDKKARLKHEKELREQAALERERMIAEDVKYFFDLGYSAEDLSGIYSERKKEFKISDKKLEKEKKKALAEAEKKEKMQTNDISKEI